MNRTTCVAFRASRAAASAAAAAFLVFLMIYNLVLDSGLFPGVDADVDTHRERLKDISARQISVEGQFLDRWGNPVTEPSAPGEPARILYDEAYSYLIGYNSRIYGTSGLRKKLYHELFYGGADGRGASVSLTTDNDLQEYCYRQVLGCHEGSVVVMDVKTGELLACTSRSSVNMGFNANRIDDCFGGYAKEDAFFLNRAVFSQDPPGSTFKIVTAASMLENGMEGYTYDDETGVFQAGGASIHNFDGAVYGAGVNLEKALNRSVNVYFASAALSLTSGALQNTASRFQFGRSIALDFARLESNLDLGGLNNHALLSMTAFGQGRLVASPLQICLVMGAVLNKGVIMKPYLISNLEDEGRTRAWSRSETLSRAVSADVAASLKDYLRSNAEYYGFSREEYGMVYAKTGTADQADGGNHLYYLLGLETETGTYAALIDWRNCTESSSALKPSAVNLIRFLSTMQTTGGRAGTSA